MNTSRVLTALILGSMLTLTGCKKEDAADAASGAAAGVTTSLIAKTWNSSCLAGNDLIDPTHTDHYKMTLTLQSDGTYDSVVYWYNGTCVGANYSHMYYTYGTFAIGNTISSDTAEISFTTTGSEIMPLGSATIQGAMNTACGGSSPLLASANSGGHYSTYMATCSSMNFPNSGGRKVIDNIVTYSNGVLSVGAPYAGIPGVFHGDAVPSTATMTFN